MWEVFSVGRSPYRDMHPVAVIGYLKNKERLEIPKNIACNETV